MHAMSLHCPSKSNLKVKAKKVDTILPTEIKYGKRQRGRGAVRDGENKHHDRI